MPNANANADANASASANKCHCSYLPPYGRRTPGEAAGLCPAVFSTSASISTNRTNLAPRGVWPQKQIMGQLALKNAAAQLQQWQIHQQRARRHFIGKARTSAI